MVRHQIRNRNIPVQRNHSGKYDFVIECLQHRWRNWKLSDDHNYVQRNYSLQSCSLPGTTFTSYITHFHCRFWPYDFHRLTPTHYGHHTMPFPRWTAEQIHGVRLRLSFYTQGKQWQICFEPCIYSQRDLSPEAYYCAVEIIFTRRGDIYQLKHIII